MPFDPTTTPFVIILAITGTGLLLSQNWRVSIAWLSIQYVAFFFLVLKSWPLEMAIVKLVGGWIAGAVLGLVLVTTSTDSELEGKSVWPTGRLFRLFAVLLSIITVWSVIPGATSLIPNVSAAQVGGGLILMVLGILHVSFITNPFRTILGLLTFLGGFEIIYAAVERSILVAGLLAAVTLALALTGAYLLNQPEKDQHS